MSGTSTASRKQATGGKDYGYSNARIRGMRARLLSKDYLDGLIESRDMIILIQALSETEYAPELEDALIKSRDAAAVDEALKNNMVRTYRKVLGFLNEEAAYIITTLLGRWDVFNIKTLLRGKHMKLPAKDIAEGLLPAGFLSQVDLDVFSMVEDVRAVVDTAVTWGLPYGSAMREGYMAFMRSGELADLELAIDRYYANWANTRLSRSSSNMQLARKLVRMQVDITNLVTVFRMQKANVEHVKTQSFFLEGGEAIGRDLYVQLTKMSDIDEVLERLRGTPYGKTLDDVTENFIEENSIVIFERALEDLLMRKALHTSTGDPLGVGVAVSYLWAKQNEVTNLRIIVKGTAVGMPEDRMRGELILV